MFSQEPDPQARDVSENRGSFHDSTGKTLGKNRALRHHGCDDIGVKGLKMAVN